MCAFRQTRSGRFGVVFQTLHTLNIIRGFIVAMCVADCVRVSSCVIVSTHVLLHHLRRMNGGGSAYRSAEGGRIIAIMTRFRFSFAWAAQPHRRTSWRHLFFLRLLLLVCPSVLALLRVESDAGGLHERRIARGRRTFWKHDSGVFQRQLGHAKNVYKNDHVRFPRSCIKSQGTASGEAFSCAVPRETCRWNSEARCNPQRINT